MIYPRDIKLIFFEYTVPHTPSTQFHSDFALGRPIRTHDISHDGVVGAGHQIYHLVGGWHTRLCHVYVASLTIGDIGTD